jgi:hypothetical protein
MLELFTSGDFADWFDELDDATAEDVATALDVIERLGPGESPPGSREALLWFEHASMARFVASDSLAWDVEAYGVFREYTAQVLKVLESPRFVARLGRLDSKAAGRVLAAVRELKRAADPRLRWQLKLGGDPCGAAAAVRPETATSAVRRLYFDALEAAGFEVAEPPSSARALREFSRRHPGPAFRLLYGVHAERGTGVVVLGEWLDRSYYGDSVRRAERLWQGYLQGELAALERAPLR